LARTAKSPVVEKRAGARRGKARTAPGADEQRAAGVAETRRTEGAAQLQIQGAQAGGNAAKRAVSIEDAGLARLAMVETGGLSPLTYLLRVMRDEGETPARRMDAAKTAAPFVHPKLATMDVQSAGLDRMGDALAELIERAQGDGGGVDGLLGR